MYPRHPKHHGAPLVVLFVYLYQVFSFFYTSISVCVALRLRSLLFSQPVCVASRYFE